MNLVFIHLNYKLLLTVTSSDSTIITATNTTTTIITTTTSVFILLEVELESILRAQQRTLVAGKDLGRRSRHVPIPPL